MVNIGREKMHAGYMLADLEKERNVTVFTIKRYWIAESAKYALEF